MAQRLFPNRSPLGQRFGRLPEDRERFEIVGVVKDARYGSLTEPPQATAYYSYEQQDEILNNLLVRYAGSPDSVVRQVRQAFREVNRNLPVDEVVTLSEQIDRSLGQPKLIARLAAFFGLLALVLASVGLYGLLSYTAGRRANEIGIRRALGARRGDVLWLVLGDALALVGVGVAVGLAVSLTASRAATALLFGLRPNDPLTITCATLLILAVAAVAGYLPAHRSTKLDPLVALRYE
jgi:ABC-type antimicrobial peptide transport system permease subunit